MTDKKFWTNGWWLGSLDEAKDKAEKTDQWRISYTDYFPRDLKLIAVKKLGRWWTNRFVVSYYADRWH